MGEEPQALRIERVLQQVKKDKVEFIQLQFTDILGLFCWEQLLDILRILRLPFFQQS